MLSRPRRSNNSVDRITRKTARKISDALEEMVASLPVSAASQMALELVVCELAWKQEWFMQLIMEDEDIREAYWAETALLPLRVKRPKKK